MKAALKRWSDATKAWGKKVADGARGLWAKTKAAVTRKPAAILAPPTVATGARHPAPRSLIVTTNARTQPMAFGAMTSRRYGSFAGKTVAPATSQRKRGGLSIGISIRF